MPNSPIWILEQSVFDADAEELSIHLNLRGIENRFLTEQDKLKLLAGEPLEWVNGIARDMIFHGSVWAARRFVHGECIIPFSPQNYRCSVFYPEYFEYLVNRDYCFYQRRVLLDRAGDFWIRPDSGLKTFPALEVLSHEVVTFTADIPYDELILLSSRKKIAREWRILMRDEKPVTGSLYSNYGVPVEWNVTKEVMDFAGSVARDVKFKPDPFYFLDIAEADGKLGVMELSAFNCGALYRCNLDDVIDEVLDYIKDLNYDYMSNNMGYEGTR